MTQQCTRPPEGWRCTRGPHLAQEPCAAVPEREPWALADAVLWLLAKLGSGSARALLDRNAQRERALDRWFT